jgi:hypothetical protein
MRQAAGSIWPLGQTRHIAEVTARQQLVQRNPYPYSWAPARHPQTDVQATRQNAQNQQDEGAMFHLTAYARLAMIAAMVSITAGPPHAQARELPLHSIVNGDRLQPHETQLKALGYSDVTPSQAAEIDRLYRQLTHCSSGKCSQAG